MERVRFGIAGRGWLESIDAIVLGALQDLLIEGVGCNVALGSDAAADLRNFVVQVRKGCFRDSRGWYWGSVQKPLRSSRRVLNIGKKL